MALIGLSPNGELTDFSPSVRNAGQPTGTRGLASNTTPNFGHRALVRFIGNMELNKFNDRGGHLVNLENLSLRVLVVWLRSPIRANPDFQLKVRIDSGLSRNNDSVGV
jgi:hypothetical protein